jgi:hypothetical protein
MYVTTTDPRFTSFVERDAARAANEARREVRGWIACAQLCETPWHPRDVLVL